MADVKQHHSVYFGYSYDQQSLLAAILKRKINIERTLWQRLEDGLRSFQIV